MNCSSKNKKKNKNKKRNKSWFCNICHDGLDYGTKEKWIHIKNHSMTTSTRTKCVIQRTPLKWGSCIFMSLVSWESQLGTYFQNRFLRSKH